MTVRHFTFRRKGESNDRAVTVSVEGSRPYLLPAPLCDPGTRANRVAWMAVRRACVALGRAPRDLVLVELSDEALMAHLVAEQVRYTEGGLAWCVVQGQIDALAQRRLDA